MCRNIKTLYNFSPPATKTEIEAASEQFVRKISGFNKPSHINEPAFDKAVVEVANSVHELLHSLKTKAEPRNRKVEAKKAHERALARFGN